MLRSIKNSLNFIAGLFLVALFAVLASVPMHAEVAPGDITVHFSREVAVPHHLLQPGNYVFRHINAANPDTYEILANNGQDFVGFFQVMPTERLQDGNCVVNLSQPDAAGVRLVKAWYGPGQMDGYQFIYSRRDIRKLNQVARLQEQPSASFAGQP